MPKDDSLVGDAGDAGDAAGDAGDAAGDAGDAAGDAGSTTDLPVDDSSKLRAFLSILRK